MRKIKSIMAALDLSGTDDKLLKFANYFAGLLEAKKLTSAHVVPVLVVGGLVKFVVGEILMPAAPALGRIQEDLEKKTKEWVKLDDLEVIIKLVEGRPYFELLKLLEETETDLLIMGKKKFKSGSGITAKQIARHAKCDILIVPEESQPNVKRIIVAMDFSENSARAVARALGILQQLNGICTIECLHVIDVYTLSKKNENEPYLKVKADFTKKMEGAFDNFLSKYAMNDKKVNCTFLQSGKHNISKTILTYAKDTSTDLIVLGAKGHSAIEQFLMGSVAELMVDADIDIPVYIVR